MEEIDLQLGPMPANNAHSGASGPYWGQSEAVRALIGSIEGGYSQSRAIKAIIGGQVGQIVNENVAFWHICRALEDKVADVDTLGRYFPYVTYPHYFEQEIEPMTILQHTIDSSGAAKHLLAHLKYMIDEIRKVEKEFSIYIMRNRHTLTSIIDVPIRRTELKNYLYDPDELLALTSALIERYSSIKGQLGGQVKAKLAQVGPPKPPKLDTAPIVLGPLISANDVANEFPKLKKAQDDICLYAIELEKYHSGVIEAIVGILQKNES
jgi:hypothetical protein